MYPVNLILTNKPVLVIGGGLVAQRKILTLMQEAAKIQVIAPEITPEIKALVQQGHISWLKRNYQRGDLQGFYICICAIDNEVVAEEIALEAEVERILLNVVNNQAKCSFTVPAQLVRGDLLVTVSTGGKSPAMAKYIKGYLAKVLPENYGDWIHIVDQLRKEAIAKMPTARDREAFWRHILSEEIMALVEAGEFQKAEAKIRHAISSFRLKS